MNDLRDNFEDAVSSVVDIYSTHEILRELLEEKIGDVIRGGFDVENAIFEVSDNEGIENQLRGMENHIKDEVIERICNNFRISL